jgi:hypothetical protein
LRLESMDDNRTQHQFTTCAENGPAVEAGVTV